MKSNGLKGVLFLILAAIIWGLALVAQKLGTENLGPFSFTGIRVFQQIGIQYTTVGKSGFITALYIILVPLGGLVLKRNVEKKVWLSVFIALGGVNKGDILMLLGSFGCTIHIYIIDHYVNKIDPVKFSCLQFLVTGIICLILALFLEEIHMDNVLAAVIPILYTGVCSCGLGYTFQILGQKYVEPAKASLILSSETIFTMLAGMLIFGEVLSLKEYTGCGLIFFAIILSQIQRKS